MVQDDKDIIANAFKPLEITEEAYSGFFELWKEESFDRHDFITEAGAIERRFCVVKQGVQVIYILDEKGDKRVIGFSFDGSFSGVYDSFLYNTPSHYFLEALTPTTLFSIDKQGYDSLFTKYPEFNYWGRIAHQQLLLGRVKREVELISMSAKERFQTFMDRCPDKLREIPQKYLASYLNMTPETFSRMRASKS